MPRAPEQIRGIMSTDVVCVQASDTVADAVEAMLSRDIGSVVVLEAGAVVGVFTERDLLRHVTRAPDVLTGEVRDLMSSPPIVIGSDVQVSDAFDVMSVERIRRLPVVDDGALVGIVTERDLLQWVRDVSREPT